MYQKAFLHTLILAIALFTVHFGISMAINEPTVFHLSVIHGVLALLTFGGLSLLLAIHKFDENKLGFAFLAVSTIKLLIAASLILVLVKVMEQPKSIATHFAAMYFLYVVFLAYKTFKLLNKN